MGDEREAGKHVQECMKCKHKRKIPGDCHIRCNNPDPEMTGDKHGMANGWFVYPINFDPVWKTKACSNFEPVDPAWGDVYNRWIAKGYDPSFAAHKADEWERRYARKLLDM